MAYMETTKPVQISGNVRVHLAQSNGKPQIEIRTTTTNREKIQDILQAAWNNKPIALYPEIRNKPTAINQLLKHKIIEREGEEYYFK